ncbi:MAG: TorF family putative porin [Sideroxydans sp.]|nr:TorF family putative porin [Sideroxydans sp.]
MLKKTLIAAALASAFAMPAFAESSPVSFNASLTTNYLYRGISQTNAKPAIQGGVDYANANGLYIGAWASTISWLKDAGVVSSAPLEIDTYAGYKGAVNSDVSYDVGFLRYNYPGSYNAGMTKADTNEIYGAVSYNIVTAKLSYSLGDLFGVADAKGSTYFELNANYPLADTGVTLGGHYGKQTYTGTTVNSAATYSDYKLSASKDFSGYTLAAALSGTNAGAFYTNPEGKELGKTTVVLSVTRAF